MQLLRDNLTLWTSEMQEEGKLNMRAEYARLVHTTQVNGAL